MGDGSDSGSELDGDHGEGIEDDDRESAYELLERQRKLWLQGSKKDLLNFKVTLLGGKWSLEHKQKAVAEFMGSANRGQASEWCDAQQLPKSARFDPAKYGGETMPWGWSPCGLSA